VFAAFCDSITSGAAPFEKVDLRTEDGKMFGIVMKASYMKTLTYFKVEGPGSTLVEKIKPDQYCKKEFDDIILQKLEIY